jgi:hypothetical protein
VKGAIGSGLVNSMGKRRAVVARDDGWSDNVADA